MVFPIRFSSLFLLWLLFVATFGSAALSSCGTDTSSGQTTQGQVRTGEVAGTSASTSVLVAAGPQPLLDSTYLINTLRAEPRFKPQLLPARRFYRERGFRLGWFKDHQLVPQAQALQAIIAKAQDEGLNPKDYQIKNFGELFAELEQARSDTARRNTMERQIDVALTGTYLAWASDYYRGVANPQDSKNSTWQVKPNKIKLNKALLTFLGERKSRYNYYEFAPLHPEYDQLKKALAAYRAQERAGGWLALPAGLHLKPGQHSPAVEALRKRLLPSNQDSPGSPGDDSTARTSKPAPATPATRLAATPAGATSVATTYDPELVAAVKGFQQDAGLKPDGVVGGETLRELNVPIGSRIDQLILNMERWRWLPKRFEPNYLLVNIPEYTLHVIEDNKEAFAMRVIVGKDLHETPIFSDKMEYVVLAPYWNVPFSIIQNELREKLVANPNYLDRLDMEVVKGSGKKAVVIKPSAVNWADVTEENFKYTVRRRPGPENDLGNMKFIFPNSNDVYLHDTPHRELFAQSARSFSHGCVRVQDPMRLATYLLRDKPDWNQQAILDTIATRREKYVPLKSKLPVYLVYFTAWADADGHPHFRKDIYGHDKSLAREYFD